MWPDRLPLWQRRSYFSISGDKLSNPGMRVLTGFLLFIYVWGCIAYETARPGAVPFVFSASPTLTLCRPVLKPPKNPQISEGPRENLSANGFSPLVLSSLSQDKPAKRLRRERRSKIRFPSFITGQTRGAFAEGRGGAKYASRLLSQDKPAERLSCEEEEQRNERTLPPSGKASDIELAPTRFTNCS